MAVRFIAGLFGFCVGCNGAAAVSPDAPKAADAPVVADAAIDAPALPVAGLRPLPWVVGDVVFDVGRNVLYASVPSRSSTERNSVVSIDPASGAAVGAFGVGIDPGALALSDDGRFLYVGIDGSGSLQRIDLGTGTVSAPVPLVGRDTANVARKILVMPGTPGTVVVSLRVPQTDVTPRFSGLVRYDDLVPGPFTDDLRDEASEPAFADATTLFGYDDESSLAELYVFDLDAAGFHKRRTMRGAPFGTLTQVVYDRGWLIGGNGRVLDATTLTAAGLYDASGAIAVAPTGSPVFIAGSFAGDTSGSVTLASFDRQTFLPTRALYVPIPTASPYDRPQRLVRWSERAFAIRMDDKLYLVDAP